MIEDQLDRIAVAIERVANLMDRSVAEEHFGVGELTSQLVPDTLGGLTPGIYTNSVPPNHIDIPAADARMFAPPAPLVPAGIDDAVARVMGDGPVHHTGAFIAPPPGDGGELDSAGHRWDARIHMDAKTKLKKTGEWKLKREIDKDLVAAVFAEQVAAPTAPPNPTPSPTQTIAPPPAGVVTQPVPPAPPLAAVGTTAPPLAAVGTTAPTMKDFVTKVFAAGYRMETMQPFLAAHGITALPSLVKSPELIPVILAEMGVM